MLVKEGSQGASERKEAVDAGWVKVVPVGTDSRFSKLGAGEAATLTHARRTGAPALLDDQVARSHALRCKLRVSGTAGVLVIAKRKGFVDVIEPLLGELRKRNFRLSDNVFQDALVAAGERLPSDKPG